MVWTNAAQLIYHGTDEHSAAQILANGIHLASCRPLADFGPGFYVTSSLHQAQQWANQKVRRIQALGGPSVRAAVVMFDFDRDKAGDLNDHLTFVIAGADFFDFVNYNRTDGNKHHRAAFYDAVYGPVSAYPETIMYMNCDQICLLTTQAVSCATVNGTPARNVPVVVEIGRQASIASGL
jgi:Protein of unknown function (DUF3990)